VTSNDAAADANDGTVHIHREMVQLGVLMLIALAAFFATRSIAASNRTMNLRDAAEWYQRGQQALGEGRITDAIDAFRRTTVRNRQDKRYVLALAGALARNGDDEAARGVLMALRDTLPEDSEINLELARLTARHGDVDEAARFYYNALYAPWPVEKTDERRNLRLELVRFLIAHNQPGRALAELQAVAADLPDEPAARVRLGTLFAEAGDDAHALDQFQRALRTAPGDGAALAGAGLSAFRLGQYALARTYLRRAPASLTEAAATLDVVESVLSNDPLASRLGPMERRRRLIANLDYGRQRLSECLAARAATPDASGEAGLQREADQFLERLHKPTSVLDQDTSEAGVDLVDRLARQIARDCGTSTPRDRALALVARQHAGDSK
jgi:thioredoxin-like negative regulator of GroEL